MGYVRNALCNPLFNRWAYNQKKQNRKSATQQLIELTELKEKGILSDDEFQAKKIDLLKM